MKILKCIKDRSLIRLCSRFLKQSYQITDIQLVKLKKQYLESETFMYQKSTRSRRLLILPQFINTVLYVYNGQKYKPLYIRNGMIFKKFGEFVLTKKMGCSMHDDNKLIRKKRYKRKFFKKNYKKKKLLKKKLKKRPKNK